MNRILDFSFNIARKCHNQPFRMYEKRYYGFGMTFWWSKKPFLIGLLYSAGIAALAYFSHLAIALPWQPVSVVGIAVAFYLGFKNNSSYDRTWEARKIWGSIVNNSRSFGAAVVSFVQGSAADELRKELIYRHRAWLVALRYQLRLRRSWEHANFRLDIYIPEICEEYNSALERELQQFIKADEINDLNANTNRATQIMRKQAQRLQEIRNQGYYDDFRHMELHQLMVGFYEDQGKSERIKNFPFPRQYASTALWLCYIFCALVPLGMMDILGDYGHITFWISPLLSALVIWVFFLMEKIGDFSENPFEGTYNDVPITNISRGIEIDLREMINDENIPGPTEHQKGFLL